LKRTVNSGKTLLADGPVSSTLLSGEVEILGTQFETDSRMVIREGKCVPFEVKANAEFDLLLGEKARLEEIEGTTIPNSWENTVYTILGRKEEYVTVMVVGGTDVGKTLLCARNRQLCLNKKE
jgi:polynucleotide 5'-kinase involved in rRNA processing